MTRRQAAMMKNFDPSAPSPFTKLPDEILESIFKFLDRQSLLNSLLVNSRWKLVIETSSKLMEKLLLIVKLEDAAQYLGLGKSQRFYQEIKVIDPFTPIYKPIPKKLIETLKKVGAKVKTLNYSNYGEHLSELLSCFPNAEIFIIDRSSLSAFTLNIQLSKVKTLKLFDVPLCDPADLNSLFSMFPTVQHLHLI